MDEELDTSIGGKADREWLARQRANFRRNSEALAVSDAVASAHLSGVDLPADHVETVGKVARGEVTADDAVHAVVDSGLRDKLAQGLHNQHCEKAFTDCAAMHWHDWREQADILMEWAVGPAIDDAGQEVKRLRAELEKAHVFIGEMVLADMEPPLPPYGSEERAEAERVQPDTEATEQAAAAVWKIEVEIPMRVIGEVDHAGLFEAVSAAAHRWEPDVRDRWDVSVSSGLWVSPEPAEHVAEQAPREPRVWSVSDVEPAGVTAVVTAGGAVFYRSDDRRWRSDSVMHGRAFTWSDLVNGCSFVTEVIEGGTQ